MNNTFTVAKCYIFSALFAFHSVMWNVLLYTWHIRSSCHERLCILAKSNNPELPYLCTLWCISFLWASKLLSQDTWCASPSGLKTLHKWNREIDQMCQLDFPLELVMRKIWLKAAASCQSQIPLWYLLVSVWLQTSSKTADVSSLQLWQKTTSGSGSFAGVQRSHVVTKLMLWSCVYM